MSAQLFMLKKVQIQLILFKLYCRVKPRSFFGFSHYNMLIYSSASLVQLILLTKNQFYEN